MVTLLHAIDTRATAVEVTEERLVVRLADGRELSVPLTWFPRLVQGTHEERANCRLIGQGAGILWPALDEHVSIERLLAGRASEESDTSFQVWLRGRRSAQAYPM